MSGAVTRIGRNRAKTWSSLGNLGRKPSEYEVVTHGMNHTYRNGDSEPLEMTATAPGNVWLKEHRDPRLFGVTKWDDFRDPDELTYRKYCHNQDEQETYVDELLKNFTSVKKSDSGLSSDAVEFFRVVLTPGRYLAHGQQMLSAYIQQMAPSAYVGNCATFQTADTLRRVQRIAYRTKQLANAHPSLGFGKGERAVWENDAGWQPIRRIIEELLIVYDFDRAFVGYELCVRPVLDNLFLQQFARQARAHDAEVDALIAENLYVDTLRGNRWTAAVARFVAEQSPTGRSEMRQLLAECASSVDRVIEAGGALLTRYSTGQVSDKMHSQVLGEWATFINEAGLGGDA